MRLHFIDLKIFIFLLVYSIILLLLISPDSYLYDLYGKCDSVVFYNAGKAWMNGMVPYRDFSEMKGPLLFLYYGVGYLISPRNYLGLYWLSCFLYAGIFYLAYLIAKIFLCDRITSLAVSTLMGLSFFCPFVNSEIRAEDLCCVFSMWSLFRCCLHIYGNQQSSIKMSMFIIGLSIGACFLIKFTFSAMLLIFFLYLVYCCRHLIGLGRAMIFVFAGALAIILPFYFFLLYEGNLMLFVEGYILTAFYHVGNNTGDLSYIQQLMANLLMHTSIYVLVVSLVSTLVIIPFITRFRFFPFISFAFFYLITLQNGVFQYYYASCAIFSIFGFIALMKFLKNLGINGSIVSAMSIPLSFLICVIGNFYGYYRWSKPNLFFEDTFYRQEYYYYASLLAQKKKPYIISFGPEWGFGTPAQSLPACRYWFEQTAYTQEMEDDRWNAIEKRIPDFVMMPVDDERKVRMNSLGYRSYYYEGSKHLMYSKHHYLNIPTNVNNISGWSVLKKCNIVDLINGE